MGEIRENSKRQLTNKQAEILWASFERFLEKHGSAVPGWLAAARLRMTPQGVFAASERGWLTYFQHGRNRLYSGKDIAAYRWNASRKFNDHKPTPPHKPGLARFNPDADTPRKRAVLRALEPGQPD